MFALLVLLPLVSYGLTRSEERRDAAIFQHTPSEDGSGGGGGSSSSSSTDGSGEESSDPTVNEEAAQALLDELIANGGPNTEELPQETELDVDEVEEEVAAIDTTSPGSGFLTIFMTIITRFTLR